MRALSGIQPSGKIHLGNYFGAIRQNIGLQEASTALAASAQVLPSVFIRLQNHLQQLPDTPGKKALQDVLALGGDTEVELLRKELATLAGSESGPGRRLPEGVLDDAEVGFAAFARDELTRYSPKSVDRFFFIANYHALTSIYDAETMRSQSIDVALDYLALGLDPERSSIYRQSDVPQVTELTWLLTTVTPMGLLERCHAYKDKVTRGIPADHGLFAYPVLMAADILIVDADIVPVGQDQRQHVEVTRDIAGAFNARYGDVFVLPDSYILPDVAIVPGTDGQKMSKSYGNTIHVFAEGKALKSQVMGIVTDSTPLEAPKDPEKDNVLAILKLFATPEELADWENRYRAGGTGYGHAKLRLLELINERFGPARQRRAELAAQPKLIEDILQAGGERARSVAVKVLQRARKACGIE